MVPECETQNLASLPTIITSVDNFEIGLASIALSLRPDAKSCVSTLDMDSLKPSSCPRCHASFECRVDAIHLCQCRHVELDTKERAYIAERFDDCLCASCIEEMKKEYRVELQKKPTNSQ